jgi:hypothetical protein
VSIKIRCQPLAFRLASLNVEVGRIIEVIEPLLVMA